MASAQNQPRRAPNEPKIEGEYSVARNAPAAQVDPRPFTQAISRTVTSPLPVAPDTQAAYAAWGDLVFDAPPDVSPDIAMEWVAPDSAELDTPPDPLLFTPLPSASAITLTATAALPRRVASSNPLLLVASPIGAIVRAKALDARAVVASDWSATHYARQRRFAAVKERPLIAVLRALGQVSAYVLGFALVALPLTIHEVERAGLQAVGPLLGMTLIVFSLFGELPRWISWTQKLGSWLTPGVIVGTLFLILLYWQPGAGRPESSFFSWSPRVWLAYLSILLVSVSFEVSGFPARISRAARAGAISPAIAVPLYVIIAGLAGNFFDGVTIIAISAIIFFRLLPRQWAIRASFALLFGGLISNLITVAAEPTNIKFQDALFPVLDQVNPSYWFMNWPISVVGILLPAIWLGRELARCQVTWCAPNTSEPSKTFATSTAIGEDHGSVEIHLDEQPRPRSDGMLSSLALFLLVAGVVANSITHFRAFESAMPPLLQRGLWAYLVPAGFVAILHISSQDRLYLTIKHFAHEARIWIRLMAIFSLLWMLTFALTESTNVFGVFFDWPIAFRYPLMLLLSLGSAVTDNVALASMQAALLLRHPLPTAAIRLLFILLTWAGGLTAFGCLQSLALHSRFPLSAGEWFRESRVWAGITIVGGLIGLLAVIVIYPGELMLR
jgi:hypothetical protein